MKLLVPRQLTQTVLYLPSVSEPLSTTFHLIYHKTLTATTRLSERPGCPRGPAVREARLSSSDQPSPTAEVLWTSCCSPTERRLLIDCSNVYMLPWRCQPQRQTESTETRNTEEHRTSRFTLYSDVLQIFISTKSVT